ncbi:MAG: hypothetical protein L0Z62_30815 [Gemmataceae bacterium]|nr:hypothetical protein [Gemmataceae bacterium]
MCTTTCTTAEAPLPPPIPEEREFPHEELDLLLENQRYPEAVRLVAQALPKREAVWWACQCVRQAGGPQLPATAAAALGAAEKWAADPSEDNRRSAFAAAQAVGFGTPAGCAAVAAFWSGGSLGPANIPPIPPAEHLTAQGVAGAVLLAAVLHEPEKAGEKYRRFVALGKEVAGGKNRWQEAHANRRSEPEA